MNSPVKWYGGKYYLRKMILNIIDYHFPHQTYVEPFVGGASILFAKKPSKREIINDVDEDLINFYVQVRDQYEILMDVIDEFDYSRASFEQSKGYGEKTDLTERAAYWFVNNRLSYSGKGEHFSQSSYIRRGMEEKTSAYLTAIQNLRGVSERLANVEIKCCSFESMIPSNPNWLIYLDPPYLKDSRITQTDVYKYEMDYAQHKLMLDMVMSSDSKFIISHYAHSLYMDRLKGLTKFEIKNYNHGSQKINKLNEHIWVKT